MPTILALPVPTPGRALRQACIAVCGALPALAVGAPAAEAHPHIWVNNVTTFVFEGREVVAVRHRWTFDEVFSSFLIEEHDADGDGTLDEQEVASLRADAFSALADVGYFTHIRVDGERLPMREVEAFRATIEDEAIVYNFELRLPEPVDPTARAFSAGVYDAEYYVEILLDQYDPVRFAGIPNGACIYDIREDEENPIYYGMVYPLAIRLNCATS